MGKPRMIRLELTVPQAREVERVLMAGDTHWPTDKRKRKPLVRAIIALQDGLRGVQLRPHCKGASSPLERPVAP